MKETVAYHIVPEYIYKKSINKLGNYDCRGFEDSKFIHTTLDLKELKKVADILFSKNGKYYEPHSAVFLLLKINLKKVKTRKGFVKPCYCHIYGSIPKSAYSISKLRRNNKGEFIF